MNWLALDRGRGLSRIDSILAVGLFEELFDKETGRPTADLSELLYGNRKRSVSNLLGENSNPTAHTLEQMAKFFGVPIDYFFVEDEEQKLTENTPVTVYMRTIIDTQKKLIQDQEERIKNLEKIVELREEEMTLYKNK